MTLPRIPIHLSFKLGNGLGLAGIITFVAPISAIVVSAIVLAVVVWPRVSQVMRMRTENKEFESRAQLMAQKIKLLETLSQTTLNKQLGDAELIIPSDKAIFTFVRQIEDVAEKSGIVLAKIDTQPGSLSGSVGAAPVGLPSAGAGSGSTQDAAPKMQVRVDISADYRSFLSFIENLFSLARITAIRELSISTGGEGIGALRISMTIDAFWKSLPTELGSIETPIQNLTSEQTKILQRASTAVSSGLSIQIPTLVPVGKQDLFAPF